MPRRLAFLIGNQTFPADSGLPPLRGPLRDIERLAEILRDPERGGYEVTVFPDRDRGTILTQIEDALANATPHDAVLLYYAGHGKTDRAGRLCLATAETRESAIYSTSIRASDLNEMIDNSDCDQVVLLLDCCFSGAVGREFTRGGSVRDQLQLMEEAKGLHVLTASTSFETAREEEQTDEGVVMGKFTHAIVAGILTGAADRNGDGLVSLSDLREHLRATVRGQTPQYFSRNAAGGDPVIARSIPAETPAQRRLRQLGAWHAAEEIGQAEYLAMTEALSGRGDGAVRRRLEALIDDPRVSAAAVSAFWAGAMRPPPARAVPPQPERTPEPETKPRAAPPPHPTPSPPAATPSPPRDRLLWPRLTRKGRITMLVCWLGAFAIWAFSLQDASAESGAIAFVLLFLLLLIYGVLICIRFASRIRNWIVRP